MTRSSDVGVSVIIPVRGASASLAVQLSVPAAPSAVVPAMPKRTDECVRAPCGERATNNDAVTGAARGK